jgi:hypothetical protein
MTFRIRVPPAAKARAYDLYHHQPKATLVQIAGLFGVTVKTFTNYRRAWGWTDRRQALFDALQAAAEATESVADCGRRPGTDARSEGPAAPHGAPPGEPPGESVHEPPGDPAGPAPPAFDRNALRDAAQALARVTQVRLKALAADQKAGRASDPDKTARTLADYARTLSTAQALLSQEKQIQKDEARDDECRDDDPRSLNDLHAELSSHLERLVAQEEARGGDGRLVEG